jgi:hypothetical protein
VSDPLSPKNGCIRLELPVALRTAATHTRDIDGRSRIEPLILWKGTLIALRCCIGHRSSLQLIESGRCAAAIAQSASAAGAECSKAIQQARRKAKNMLLGAVIMGPTARNLCSSPNSQCAIRQGLCEGNFRAEGVRL